MSNLHEQIEAAANEWMAAWVRADKTALEEALAPDFALTVSAAPSQRLDRANWLSTACSRYRASEFSYRDVQVRDLGAGLASMSSVAEFQAEIDGNPRTGPLFLVDLWRLIDGRWRVCARFSSAIEKAQGSAATVAVLR